MAFSQADLAAIRSAIARGERSVTFSDRTVVYRSMDELFQAEQRISQALAGRPKQTLVIGAAGKGF